MKNKLDHKYPLLFFIGLMGLITACASQVPAPLETATIIDNQSSPHVQARPNAIKSQNIPHSLYNSTSSYNGYICEDAPIYIGKSIGDGECVDLIKLCSNAPLTRFWKPGKHIFGEGDVPAGTAIATFRKGKYPNRSGYHAAIYSHQDEGGIYAWDQWQGQAVHLRYILARQRHKDDGNNASKYRVIKR